MREQQLITYLALCYMVGGVAILFAADVLDGIWAFLDKRSEEGRIVFWSLMWGFSPLLVPLAFLYCILWLLMAITVVFAKGIHDWVMGPIR